MAWPAHRIAGERDAILAELDRELDNRTKVFPDRIAKGRMTEQEADYQLAIWREICDNIDQCLDRAHWHVAGIAYPWRDKIRALDRELDYRARLFPEWVQKGRLDQATADRRLDLLQAVRDLYWRNLFAYMPTEGPALAYLKARREGPWSGGRIGEGTFMGEDLDGHPGKLELYDLIAQHVDLIDKEDEPQQENLL